MQVVVVAAHGVRALAACTSAADRRSRKDLHAAVQSVDRRKRKGQLVREIDALGGAMAALGDRCSLHARFFNESKGPAVRALRQQMDKPAYARASDRRAARATEPRDRARPGRRAHRRGRRRSRRRRAPSGDALLRFAG